MKDKNKNKITGAQLLSLCIYAAVGGVCGNLVVRYTDRWGGVDDPGFLYLAVMVLLLFEMYVAAFLQIVIHEGGHLVCGLLSGYRFSSFRVGSLMLLKSGNKLVWKRLSLAGTGGQCLMIPPQMENGSFPVTLYNLGGPGMNLLSSAVFAALLVVLPADSPLAPLILMAAVWGVAFALTNGIPMRLGAVNNDGHNALSLRKDPAAMEAFWLQLKINELSIKGVRLKDMPEEWFSLPADDAMQNSLVAAKGLFLSNRLMDQARFAEADALLTHLLSIDSAMIDLHRNLSICDRIYLELIGENRSQILAAFLTDGQQKFMKSMKNFPSVIRTRYAYALLADRDTAQAEAYRAQFEKVAKSYPCPTDVESERELMALAESIARQRSEALT